MNKVLSFSLLSFLFTFSIYGQEDNLEDFLTGLPDATFRKVETNPTFESTYEIRIKQPLDHSDATKGFFHQHLFLSHKGLKSTTVIATEGYKAFQKRIYEPTKLLNANQLVVEHRYYGNSIPDSVNYRYLNMQQATADLHRIKQLFSELYAGQWVSTGGSKGGVTTIFYRYFYPEDVVVSIPYVAPIKRSYDEKRIYHFLDTVGTEECRSGIEAFQRRLLDRRSEILPLLDSSAEASNQSFERISLNKAFEYAVMEYSFAFWQRGENCDKIPGDDAPITEIFKYFLLVSSPLWFSDESLQKSESHNYQIATELGYYGYETNDFEGLLTELPTSQNPMCIFPPKGLPTVFNQGLLNDVRIWLQQHGHNFIYIYGAMDPWSAAAVPQSDQVDSEWFIMKGKHHGSARIAQMTDIERERLVSALERWLSVEINNSVLR
ncbi:MAG: S28 family serine protease [Ekhidna sp.]